MLNRISLLILFFVSYLPLFVILVFQNLKLSDEDGKVETFRELFNLNIIPFIFLFLSLLSVILYFIINHYIQKSGFKTPEKVNKVKNTGIEYLSYLGTYIIPFIGMKFDTANNSIATWILIGVIAFIYPKTNLIYANPTLALFGFNIYKVIISNDPDEEVVVITREKMKKNIAYRFKKLTDEVLFSKK